MTMLCVHHDTVYVGVESCVDHDTVFIKVGNQRQHFVLIIIQYLLKSAVDKNK